MKYKLIIDKSAEEEIVAIVHEPSELTRQIENLVNGFSDSGNVMGYRDDEIRKLSFDEIEYVTVIARKVIVVDAEGNQYRVQGRLCNMEEVLPAYFIRINKSTIANEHRILRFDVVVSGGVDAVFRCGSREYVSRRCFSEIRRRYEIK